MESTFEFYLHDGTKIKSEKTMDFIGHHELPLIGNAKISEVDSEKIVDIISYNKSIVENAENSSMTKSQRLTSFLSSYKKEVNNFKSKYENSKNSR